MRRIASLCIALALSAGCHRQDDGPAPPPPLVDPPDEPFRATRPASGTPAAFHNPVIGRFTTDDLDVILVERHTLPMVTWQLQFPGGSFSDPPGKLGLAQLCTALLVQQQNDTADRLADMGSSVNVQNAGDTVTLNGFALRPNLEATLDLWVRILRMPGMDQDDLDRLRRGVVASLPQATASPSAIAARVFAVVVYGAGHPFARVPDATSLAAVTLDDCHRFASEVLRPRGARLLVAGDITRAEVEQKIITRVASGAPAGLPFPLPPPPMSNPAPLVFSDAPGATQTIIQMWSDGPDRQAPDYYAAVVMASVLAGDGLSSRLGQDLREMMGSTYSVGGGFSFSKIGSRLIVSAPVQTDRTQAAVTAMLAGAQGMRDGDITDDELARARDGRITALPGRFETVAGTLGQFRDLAYFGLPFSYYEDYATNYRKVDKAAVRKAANDYLTDLRFVVVGDGQTVLPMLRALTTGVLQGAEVRVVDAMGKPLGGP